MKKFIYFLIYLLPILSFWSCNNKEDLVFEHEKPQFEIKSNAILLEVIVPVETNITDEIYIVGDFNGGASAAGKAIWKLQCSDKTNYRWGIYLDPATFVNGKTLADGYYFTSLQKGYEVTLEGEKVLRHETANVGTRLEGKIVRWESYFVGPNDWPIVPANKIMLRLTVPNYTPKNSQIALYGDINGWNGSTATWKATMLDTARYYFMLDPAQFAAGTDLSGSFKVALIEPRRDWWFHEANADGGPDGGPDLSIKGAVSGEAYNLPVAGWRNSSEIGVAEPEPIVIKIKQVKGSWNEIAVYSWGGSPNVEAFGGWPGRKLTPDAQGWYAIEVPDARPMNMILNDNGKGSQFDFLTDPSESACYEIDTDAKTYVAVDCPTPQPTSVTIRWKQVEGSWTDFFVYSWGGSPNVEAFGGWPGQQVTPDATGWYTILVPDNVRPINLILNNNSGAQFDFIQDPGGDACYEVHTNTSTFNAVNCP